MNPNNSYYPYANPYYAQGAVPDMLSQMKAPFQMPQPVPTQIKPMSDIIWVQGEAGAKGYLVAPNNTVVLWDTESPTIYVKTADGTGIPSMKILDFTERTEAPKSPPASHVCACTGKYPTIEEFEALKATVAVLASRYDNVSTDTEKSKTKKSKEGDE